MAENKAKITVRRAEEKDIDRILDLLLQVAMVHHNGRPDLFKAGARKYTKEELLEILSDDKRPIFAGVDENDRMLGYAFCVLHDIAGHHALTDIRTLYIDDICVDEEARGMHVGSTIYHHVLEYARSIGCYNVTLNVWTCNPAAMRFYEAMGLEQQKIGMEVIL